MVGPARPQIVLFGSSIVQSSFRNGGWGAVLADLYSRKADVLLRGYAGWNSRRALQVLDKVFPKEAPVQPALIIVYFGGNDAVHPHPSGLGPHVPLPEYIENMKMIAKYLQSLSEKTRVIFLSAPSVNEEQIREHRSDMLDIVRTNGTCKIYSEACLDVCRELNLKVIDLWTALQQRNDCKNVCFTDGIHLSAEGSKIVIKEIVRVIKEADWIPSLYWKDMATEFAEDSPYDPVSRAGVPMNISESVFHPDIEFD